MSPAVPQARPHRGLVKGLLIAMSAFAVLAIFAVWAQRQALDTDEWVDTSGRLLENSAIRDAVAEFAVNELYANVDVNQLLEKRLPPNFRGLSGPAASGLRELALEGAERALASSRLQDAWKDANRVAHRELIAIVKGRSGAVSTGPGGEVTLDLKPLVDNIAAQLGIAGLVKGKLPPDAGELHVLRSDELGLAQDIVNVIDGAALLTSVAVLALLALALYLSPGYRWITLVYAGAGLLVAGIAVLLLREAAGAVVTRNLASGSARAPADAAWSIGTSLLSSIATTVILYGGLIVLAGWLGSTAKSAQVTRRWLAPALRDHMVAVGGVLAALAAIWVGAGAGSTRAVLTRLGLVAMAGMGAAALRRQTLAEAPEASWPELAQGVRRRISAMRRARPVPAPEPEDRKLERLERLAALHERRALSDQEYEAEKAALLGRGRGEA